jgi:hypothetical protein
MNKPQTKGTENVKARNFVNDMVASCHEDSANPRKSRKRAGMSWGSRINIIVETDSEVSQGIPPSVPFPTTAPTEPNLKKNNITKMITASNDVCQRRSHKDPVIRHLRSPITIGRSDLGSRRDARSFPRRKNASKWVMPGYGSDFEKRVRALEVQYITSRELQMMSAPSTQPPWFPSPISPLRFST